MDPSAEKKLIYFQSTNEFHLTNQEPFEFHQ